MSRGGAPGTVYVVAGGVRRARRARSTCTWPSRPVRWPSRRRSGAPPGRVFIVGCEPAEVDELTTELTPPVQARRGRRARARRPAAGARRPRADPLDELQRRDEILQIMFWLAGEGLGPDVAPPTSSASSATSPTVRRDPAASSWRTALPSLSSMPPASQPLPADRAGRAGRPPPVPRRVRALPGAARSWRVRLGGLRLPSGAATAGSLA